LICQQCHMREAAIHFTEVSNGHQQEIHLCEKCAKERGDLFMLSDHETFSMNDLLAGLLNFDSAFKEAEKSFQQAPLHCPHCKMTYKQFAKVGRFGCAHCYQAFKQKLTPFLKRLQGGNSLHRGKIPQRAGENIQLKKELENLKAKLKQYVEAEEFEEAVKLRDKIRELNRQLDQKRGES